MSEELQSGYKTVNSEASPHTVDATDTQAPPDSEQWVKHLRSQRQDGEETLRTLAAAGQDPIHDRSIQALPADKNADIPGLRTVADEETTRCLDALRKADWVEKLQNIFTVRAPDRVVSMLMKAEALGTIRREDIGVFIKDSFRRELEGAQTAYRYYTKIADQNPPPKDLETLMKQQESRGKAYFAELKRCNEDDTYALEWYDRAKESLLEARDAVYEAVSSTDSELRTILGDYRRKPWNSLENRVIAVTPDEYYEMLTHLYDGDTAIDRATGTYGYATAPRLGEPRVGVIKLKTEATLADPDNPEAGIMINASTEASTSTLRHEGIHLITDGAKAPYLIETPGGPRYAESRGFRNYIHKMGGQIDYAHQRFDDPPQIALDEGAVMFLERYVRYGGDMDLIRASLERNQLDINPEYNLAALETVALVKELGFDLFASCYANSQPELWLRAVDHSFGRAWYDAYIARMKEYQHRMSTPASRVEKHTPA